MWAEGLGAMGHNRHNIGFNTSSLTVLSVVTLDSRVGVTLHTGHNVNPHVTTPNLADS